MPPKNKEEQSQDIMKESFMDKIAIKRAKETFEELDEKLDDIIKTDSLRNQTVKATGTCSQGYKYEIKDEDSPTKTSKVEYTMDSKIGFPHYKKHWFSEPTTYGWEDRGCVESYIENLKIMQEQCSYCHTIIHIGIENNKVFKFCPKCKFRLKDIK